MQQCRRNTVIQIYADSPKTGAGRKAQHPPKAFLRNGLRVFAAAGIIYGKLTRIVIEL